MSRRRDERGKPCCGTCFCWRPHPNGPDRAGLCWLGYPGAIYGQAFTPMATRGVEACGAFRPWPATDALGRPFVDCDLVDVDQPAQPVQGELFR